MKSKLYPRLFFSAIFIAIVVLAFYIAKPFLPALLSGAVIAYLAYPMYLRALNYVKNENLASLAVSLLIVLIVTVPFIVVLGVITKEAIAAYSNLDQQKLGANFMEVVCKDENWFLCRSIKSFISVLPENDIDYYLKITIEKIVGFIINSVSNFLVSVPSIFLNLFVMIFVIFYLLKDGSIVANRIKNILPLKESHKQNVFKRFHDATVAVFYSNIAIAIVQGGLGAIGFLIFGVPSPFLWGFVMIFFALIPYFGTAIIWLPAALNLIFEGYLQSSTSATVRGIGLIVYGVIIISTIDNLLKPKIIGSKAKVHPILVLVGILGGLNLFGFLGFILGPIILAILMTFIEIYEEEKPDIQKYF